MVIYSTMCRDLAKVNVREEDRKPRSGPRVKWKAVVSKKLGRRCDKGNTSFERF